MNTEEIIKEVRQSKGPGYYQLSQYYNTATTNCLNPGNNAYTNGLNPNLVDDDSFLKNINKKFNRTIKGNDNFMSKKDYKLNYAECFETNDTRNRKSCNDVLEKDYFNLGFRTDIRNDKVMFGNGIGIDSRHIKR